MNREKCYKKSKREPWSHFTLQLCVVSVVQSQRHRSKMQAITAHIYNWIMHLFSSSVPSFSLICCSSDVRSPLFFRPKHRRYPMWTLSDQLRFSSQPSLYNSHNFFFLSRAAQFSSVARRWSIKKKARELKSAVQFFAYLKFECCKKDKKKNFVPFFHYRKAASATHISKFIIDESWLVWTKQKIV